MANKVLQNGLSFDVEEYFHALNFRGAVPEGGPESMAGRVEIGTRRILELLAAAATRATFFVLGKIAATRPGLIREIAAAGHEVASHGLSHKTVRELGPDRFRAEAADSRKLLEDLCGSRVSGFRASTFSITQSTLWALDILLEEGYRYDSSIFPVYHDRYGIPSFPRHPVRVRDHGSACLVELPPLTLKLGCWNLPCGGGGYFRLYPPFLTRLAIRRMNAKAFPAVLYLHPWEFDPEAPRYRLGGLKTFRHYVNMDKTAGRLEGLLCRFAFGPLGTLAEEPDRWPLTPSS